MDEGLFMECEEEELEPWQQVDDDVDEEEVDFEVTNDDVGSVKPRLSSAIAAHTVTSLHHGITSSSSGPSAHYRATSSSSSSVPNIHYGITSSSVPSVHYGASSSSTGPSVHYGASSSSSTGPSVHYGASSSTGPSEHYGASSSSSSTVPSVHYGITSSSSVPSVHHGISSSSSVPSVHYGITSSSSSTVPSVHYGITSSSSVPSVHHGISSSLGPGLHRGITSSSSTVPSIHYGITSSSSVPSIHYGITSSSSVPSIHYGITSSSSTGPSLHYGATSSSGPSLHPGITSTSSSSVPSIPYGITSSSSSSSSVPSIHYGITSPSSSSSVPSIPYGITSSSSSSSSVPSIHYGITSSSSSLGPSLHRGITSSTSSSVPSLMSSALGHGQQLILTQTPSGAFLMPAAGNPGTNQPIFLAAQGFSMQGGQPSQSSVPQFVVNVQPGQSLQPITLLSGGVSSRPPQDVPHAQPKPQLLPQSRVVQLAPPSYAPPSASYTTIQIPATLAILQATPSATSVLSVVGLGSGPKLVMTVEEFYYGESEGNTFLRGPEATLAKSFLFKCQACFQIFEDNVRMMYHMKLHCHQGGGASENQLSCSQCYRLLSSSQQLDQHQDRVHGPNPSPSLCQICEWAFESELVFLNHMKVAHKTGEMPYVCQVCGYRSSFYSSVQSHFLLCHRDTRYLLCVYCLKVTRNNVNYQHHLQLHQKLHAFHCNKCRLQFISMREKVYHKAKHHRCFRKPAQLEGLPPGTTVIIRSCMPAMTPATPNRPLPSSLSHEAPSLFQRDSSLAPPIPFRPHPRLKNSYQSQHKTQLARHSPKKTASWMGEHWYQPLPRGAAGSLTRALPFTQPSGPSQKLQGRNSDAIDFFTLLFPPAMTKLIATETNAHVQTLRYLGCGGAEDWRPVCVPEVQGFLGLSVLMGVHNLPELDSYWSWAHDNHHTFQRTMTPQRFKQIATHLRMGSDLTRRHRGDDASSRDPLAIFRPMLRILGKARWQAYRPNCCLTMDHALLPGLEEEAGRGQGGGARGAGQPHVWLLCDSKSGYCHRLSVDVRRRPARTHSRELGFRVVPPLLAGLQDQQHQLYLASSLASVPLMLKLLDQGIYASSSFPPPSPILPIGLWAQGVVDAPGSFFQRQHGPLLATRWKDAKEMGCLCTNAAVGEEDTVWRRSVSRHGDLEPMKRPLAFKLLQENLRGADICKQLLACNPLGGPPLDRHWRSLFWFLVNLSVVNAFIVLREARRDSPPAWVQDGMFTQTAFRKRLGNQLARLGQTHRENRLLQEKNRLAQVEEEQQGGVVLSHPQRHRMVKLSPKTRRCKNCNLKNQRHESVYGCIVCKVNLCTHPRCFWEYHGLSPLNKGSIKIGFIKDSISRVFSYTSYSRVSSWTSYSRVSSWTSYSRTPNQQTPNQQTPNQQTPNQQTPSKQTTNQQTPLSARQLRISLWALCGGLRQASEQFKVPPTDISSWLARGRKQFLGVVGQQEARDQMVEWLLTMQEQQLPVSERSLFQQASTLKRSGGFSGSFRISYDWAVGFLLEQRLSGLMSGPGSRRPSLGRELPPSMEDQAHIFSSFTLRHLRAQGLEPAHLAAMDELSVYVDFKQLETQTHVSGALRLSGSSAPLLTVYLAGLADGTFLPALVLLQPPLPGFSPLLRVLLVEEGSTPEQSPVLWLQKVWTPYLAARDPERKSMLVLDGHREHTSDHFLSALSATRTLPMVTPAGCSSRLQPLAVCVRPVLERVLLHRWGALHWKTLLQGVQPEHLQATVVRLLLDWLEDTLACLDQRPHFLQQSFQLVGLGPEESQETAPRDAPERPPVVDRQRQLLSSLTNTLLGTDTLETEITGPQE
ncbi:uncharacterized protein FYW47_006818 [Aplochiton taeniatus]